ncbi:hypothetical protein E4U52_005957 [Claviceps spartinae]|nr:hypothetical protein E4U52_005957 [Claviceps spartinae]
MGITQNQVPKQQTFSNALTASHGDPKPHQPQQPAGKSATYMIDILTSENPQPQIEGKVDSLTKGVADIPSKVCIEFMKTCVESEEEFFTKSKEAEGLRSEVKSLREQLQREKTESQEKVAELTTTIQVLEEDKRQLRQVIPENELRHRVSDDEIRQRFVSLRWRIKAVVDNPKYDMTRKFMPSNAADDFEFRIN